MRGPLKREVFSTFRKEVSQRFLEFALVKEIASFWLWEWRAASNLTFFFALQAFEDRDKFVLEVAWSEDGQFPWKSLGKGKVALPQGRIRLARLWKKGGEEPVWDLAPETTQGTQDHIAARARGEKMAYPTDMPVEQLTPRIPALVHDAIDKLEQYGLPLFRQVAESHHIAWTGR